MKSFLKLVAIATVADVVPLVGENRVIVKHGLEGLHQSKNPGLQAILELSGLMNGPPPSARQVAFQIAPRINAAGRMDDAQNVIRMFLTEDAGQARELASQLHSLNQERRDTEADIVRLVLEECVSARRLPTIRRCWCFPGPTGIAAWWGSWPAAWWSASVARCLC